MDVHTLCFIIICSLILIYGILIIFGKCDKILINSTIGLDYNADEFNIFKLRLLKGCLLILTSIMLLIFTLCGIAYIFIYAGIPILIVEEILTYTWAKK